ncbi:MAG: hypothetical protein CBE33_05115 [Candidatus Pelagibacter sp. TMED273]|nr:MAG: hypothetical protein CBE33_05115 [Candidatus Pelagibacter sp. TMED273]|tara:strand:- start:841 stop:1944 length:1104 start_codon:yes stop_codon:yes gene_type:complete
MSSSSSFIDFKNFLGDKAFNKIFIICGENSFKNSGADKLINDQIKNKKIKFYFKKHPYPEIIELKKIISEINLFSPDLIVAIGGGSVLDYAKIANSLSGTTNIENEIINSKYKLNSKLSKLVAIPTTAGSGAEVTSNAVIYINNIKYSVEGDQIKPDFFFLIPELVIGASNKIKSSAAFDAIAQAIESIISKKSNEKSINFAEKSLKISLKNFINFLEKPNLENTSNMCQAANLAGEAINISRTTAPHATSYPFTSIYNISHGHAVSLTLNKFLRFNYENLSKASCKFNLEDRFKILFNLSNTKNFSSFDMYLQNLKQKAKLEDNFEKLGIDINKDYQKIISKINLRRLANNPVDLNSNDIKKIILN